MLTFISLSKFVEKFKARKTRMRRQRVQKFSLPLEALESRVLPAATIVGLPGAGATRTFVDDDGDTVTVRVSGTTGTATFKDSEAVPGAVADGDDIGSVTITGASPDFTLTFSIDADGAGADTVQMGNITSNRIIHGIYSVPLNVMGAPVGSFTLGSFIGPGFSLHGGLSADDVVGNAADVGIDLSGSLGSTNTINFRDNVDADIRIRGSLNGAIAFGGGGVTAGSAWQVDGAVGSTGAIRGNGDFMGTATFVGTFAGSATLDNVAEGNWTFKSSVLSSAHLLALGWFDVDALRDFGGQLVAYDRHLALSVGGSIGGYANIVADDGNIELTVTGSILSGARISGGYDVSATVGGNVSGTIAASDALTLDVTGALTNAVLASYADIELSVGRGITNTKLTGSDITIDVAAGGITNSKLTASDMFSVDVTGNVTGTQMTSGSADSTLDISGNLVNSQLSSGSENLTLNVKGNISNSLVQSDESDISVAVGGSITGSKLASGEHITVTVGGGVTDSTLISDSEVTLNVKGSVTRSTVSGTDTVAISVTGNVSFSTLLALDTDMTVTVGGSMANCVVNGSEITLDITGSLTNTSVTVDEGDDLEVTTGLDVIGCSFTVDDDGVTLDVGRDLIGTDVSATGAVTVTVSRNMTSSHLTSQYDEVSLDVTGNMTSSSAIATSGDITATVGGNFTNSSLTAYSDIELDVTGNASGTLTSYSSDLKLDVGGTFSGKAVIADDITAHLGSLSGSLTSAALDLFVVGNVTGTAVIQARSVDDLGDADNIGFRVGGTFAGTLTASTFDSNEDTGDGINDLVLGNVLATAKFNIGFFDGAAGELYRFGGSFLGHLTIAHSLDMDLEFNGHVHSVVIGGSVGVSQNSTITVNGGTVDYLSSNSLFAPTTPGDGDFKDGAGNITGNLVSTGFTTVVPLATP